MMKLSALCTYYAAVSLTKAKAELFSGMRGSSKGGDDTVTITDPTFVGEIYNGDPVTDAGRYPWMVHLG